MHYLDFYYQEGKAKSIDVSFVIPDEILKWDKVMFA